MRICNVDCLKGNADLLSLWGLSFCPSECLSDIMDFIINTLDVIISEGHYKNDIIYTEKFVLPLVEIRDSFSVNKQLVFCQTVLNLIRKKLISFEYIKYVLEYLTTGISIINENSIYSENGDLNKILFWENYNMLYAISLLGDLDIMSVERGHYMIINPLFFKNTDYTVKKKLVTVIMPFSTEWSDFIYKKICDALSDYQVWRSKEEIKSDAIMQSVWEHINRAEVVIADCTGKNANVFYELGIAHCLGKKVFMCAQSRDDFPFDINYLRSFLYDLTDEGICQLIAGLKSFMLK